MANSKSKQLKQVLYSLASAANSKGERFSPTDAEGVLALLKWTNKQSDEGIRELLVNAGNLFSPPHRKFFEKNGVSFEKHIDQSIAMTYRGVVINKPSSSKESPATEEPKTKKKRKIIYRGQEKWI